MKNKKWARTYKEYLELFMVTKYPVYCPCEDKRLIGYIRYVYGIASQSDGKEVSDV
jgi:hypothetical protein